MEVNGVNFTDTTSIITAPETKKKSSDKIIKASIVLKGAEIAVKDPKILERKKEYKEFIRRCAPEERSLINQALQGVTNNELNDFTESINKLNWHEVFKSPQKYPFIALAAFKVGKISKEQLSTVLFYYSITLGTKPDFVECIPLFDKKAIHPAALEIMETQTDLSKEQIKEFFDKAKRLPLSEQRLFIYLPSIVDNSIIKALKKDAHFNNWGLMENGGKNIVSLPSLSLMQNYLDIKYGKDAVKINPVIGLSSREDIKKNGEQNTRDLAVHFPFVTLPKEADGSKAPYDQFSLHDFYHAALCSSIRKKHRKGYAYIVNIMENYMPINTTSNGKNFIEKLDFVLIDQEFAEYRVDGKNIFRNIPHRKSSFFWLSFCERLKITWANQEFDKRLSEEDFLKECKNIIEYLISHKEAFEKKYRIELSYKTLKKACKDIATIFKNVDEDSYISRRKQTLLYIFKDLVKKRERA